ncbi:sugar transferase [Polynucleobacter sp. JS-Polo-80-F4]|uniref:sugar transferase n=1 Tax=Polynucleobacter sp. JS-Polo-80-F4 TaxID=2576918 RepID=UPI001C0DABDD|nr:sugar transferase [Polynucleobacter sp. JS-Polo-80-F4]MBU3616748.1 sugar transferase [Polynucleobacter sp. JS-Polo-80-F4]
MKQDTLLYKFTKRLFDLIFGILLFLISLPIIIIAIFAIRIDSPGSPIFFQKRVGHNGKLFTMIKLRGMYSNSRKLFPRLYDYSGQNDLNFHFHFAEDPRVTKVGRFTRKTSIDELPNFLNVVMGSMSLVGPRPEIPEVMNLYGPYRDEYLSVKPGITCWSKCTGRDTLTKEETILLDLGYVRSRSIMIDFKILYKTFLNVLGIKNVF